MGYAIAILIIVALVIIVPIILAVKSYKPTYLAVRIIKDPNDK
jgi:hypothetical protein